MSQETTLLIDGHVHQSRVFTVAELSAMDQQEIHNLFHACGTGEPKGVIQQGRGVLLTDILHAVAVRIDDHNDTKRMLLRVTAHDGYVTLFSWQELFNTSVGEGVLVLLERDGQSLGDRGRLDLISCRDSLSGPRYVKQLAAITVLLLE